MPLYDYKCPKCGVTTEALVAAKGAVAPRCLRCCREMERQPPRCSFKLKGKGWTPKTGHEPV